MSINLTVVIDNDEAIRKLRELQKTAKAVTSNVVTDADRMDIAMKRLAFTLGQIGAGVSLAGLVRQIARTRGEFQQLEVAFTTLLQSKEKADALMSQMVELAAKTPFDLQGVASGARQLLAYGFAAEDVTDVLTRLGNVAAGLGLNLQDLTWLYGTTAVQGRLYTRDVMQFQSRGIDLAGELATQLGKTRAEISQMVTEGKIGFPEVQKAIENMTNEGGKFYNLMQEQSKTITGQISNIGDSIQMMFNDMGKSSEGVINTVLSGVSYAVENYQAIGRAVAEAAATYGAYKAVLMTITALQKLQGTVLAQAALEQKLAAAAGVTLSNAQATAAARTKLLTIAQKGLTKAMMANPYTLIAAAVASLAYGIYKLATYQTDAEKAQRRLNEAIAEADAEAMSEQRQLARLKGELSALTKGTDEYNEVKDKIVKQFGKYYDGLDEEIDKVGLTEEAYNRLTAAINKSFGARQYEKFMSGEQDVLSDTTSESLEKIQDRLYDRFGDEVGAEIYAKIRRTLSNLQKLGGEIPESLYRMQYEGTYAIDAKINGWMGRIQRAQKIYEEMDKKARVRFGVEGNAPTQPSATGDTTQEAKPVQDKKYWEDKKKEAETALAAMDSSLKGTAKWNELMAQIAEYDKKIKQYSVSSKTEAAAAKAQKKLSDSLVQAELDLQSQRITIMREGKNKRLAEIDLEYQQTAAKINQKRRDKAKEGATEDDLSVYDQQMTAAEQKRLQNRAQVETEYAKQTAETYRQLADVFLTEEERKTRAIKERYRKMRREQLDKFLGGDIGVGDFLNITAQINKAEIKSMLQDVLREYETFEQKKARITEEYNDKIARLEEQNANGQYNENIEEIKRQRDLEIAQLQISESDFFQVISGNLEEYGLATIRDAIAQAKEYLDNFIADAKSKNGGKLTNEQLQFVTQMRQDLDKATKVVHYRLPEGLAKAASGMKKVADSAKELDESLANVLDTVSNMIQGFSDIESGISGLKEASANFKQMKQNAKDQGKSLGFGDILGTVGSYAGAIGSIVSGVTSIFGSLFSSKGNSQEVEATIERLTVRNELLQEAIERLTDKIGSGSVMDSVQAYEKAVEKQKEQNENYRKIAEAKGSYWSSHHSWNYNWGGFTDEELAWIQKNVREGFTNKDSIFSFTPEEMAALLENTEIADRIYNTAGSYGRDVYNTLVDYAGQAGKLEELTDKLNESLTQISFDSLRDSFVDSLMDMDKSAEDFADDFSSYLMRAVLNSKISELLDDELNDFYEKWVEYTKSGGGLDQGEIDELKGIWDGITEEGIKIRDELAAITGYTGSLQADSQSATSRGYQIATQDDITEQNGRLTDIQGKMSILVSGVDKLSSLGLETKNEIVNMRDIMIQLNGNVADIRTYTKVLPQMNATLISVDRKLNNL